jgi:hypothetical protein
MNKVTFFILFFLAAAFALEAQCPDNENIKVQFLGAPQVLNDSVSDNTLTFTVLNKLEKNPSARNGNKITFNKGTKFHFRFYIDDQQADANQYNRPYALTTENFFQRGIVKITGSPGTWNATTTKVPVDGTLAKSELGQITLEANKDIPLGPQEYITITISGLKSNLPSGPTIANVFIELTNRGCNNFGLQIGEIQKSPIHIGKQKVGIGTNQTNAAKLNVNGGLRANGGALKPGENNNAGYAFRNGDGSTGIASRKDGQVGVYANGKEVASFEEGQTTVNGGVWIKEPSKKQSYFVSQIEPNKAYAIFSNPAKNIATVKTDMASLYQFKMGEAVGTDRQFKLIPAGNGFYSLQKVSNRYYLTYDTQAKCIRTSPSPVGDNALFKPVPSGDGNFALEIKSLPGSVVFQDMNLTPGPKQRAPYLFSLLDVEQYEQAQEPASYITLGEKGKYQISEGANSLEINANPSTSIAFTNGSTNNLTIESNTGNTNIRGQATIGGGANINGSTEVRQNLNVGGTIQVKNTAPIVYKRIFVTGGSGSGRTNLSMYVDTGIPHKDYVGMVGGFNINGYDPLNNGRGNMRISIPNELFSANQKNLYLQIEFGTDQPISSLEVHTFFYRKEMVDMQDQIITNFK